MVAERYDIAIVGAGIVGLACARELLGRYPSSSLVMLEREQEVGQRQTTWNSGVVHAGVYYAPGSLKAELCVEGAAALYDYCDERGIRAERVGKVIVATRPEEVPLLDELERRGRANSVPGLRRIDPIELRELEPHVHGVAALHSPSTGIVDFGAVARALRADVEAAGGRILTGREVRTRADVPADRVLFCAGADADRLAVVDGGGADPRIVPFRGSYFSLRDESLVRGLVYPVPDPALPFLGVHLTRHARGGVLVGPTALLAPRMRSLAWPGTWRMMRCYWRTGLAEMRSATWKRAVAREARRFVPELATDDLEPAWAGYRAQAISRDGTLVDDFAFSHGTGSLHVRNAPSPAATSSLAIARYVADRFESSLLA